MTLAGSQLSGGFRVTGVSGQLSLTGSDVRGAVRLTGSDTGGTPIVVSGNAVRGTLSCSGNQPAPTHAGLPNSVSGQALGQCRDL